MEQKTNVMQSQVAITRQEAEEFCAYKRQKKIAEIMSAMHRAESVFDAGEDIEKSMDRVARLRQSAVRMTPVELARYKELCQRYGVKIDCAVGGNGETFAKVKAYEAKTAIKNGAGEITLLLPHSKILRSEYTELRKELKSIRRRLKKTVLKARIEKTYPQATLSRLARLVSECGAEYFSLPYFVGCERVQAELFGGCLLEVSGVETIEDFKKMAGAGMGRVLTSHAWEIYSKWIEEVEKITVGSELSAPKTEEKKTAAASKPLLLPVAASKTAT